MRINIRNHVRQRTILKYAYKNEWIDFIPEQVFERIDTSKRKLKTNKKKKEANQEIFNEEEMGKLVDVIMECPDSMNLGILLMLVTGIRVGELVALQKKDISDNTVSIRKTETAVRRLKKPITYSVKPFPKSEAGWRDVIVPKKYEWVLRKLKVSLKDDEDWVFCNKGERTHTHSIRNRMYRICRDAGVVRKSLHKLRKIYCSILLDSKIDNRMVTDQMGHASISVSEENYHRNRKNIEMKQKILDSILEFS